MQPNAVIKKRMESIPKLKLGEIDLAKLMEYQSEEPN
jgi:hypothetical protein